LTQADWWDACTATLMPLVRAGHRKVDEIGSLNERPDHPGKHIGDYYREALPLKLLDQAFPATVATYPVVSPGGVLAGWIGIASTRSIAVIKCGCIVSRSRCCTAARGTSHTGGIKGRSFKTSFTTAASGTSDTGCSFYSGTSDTGGDGLFSFTTAAPATR
jgi:hypothetical protein